MRAEVRDVTAERFTFIDRQIETVAQNNTLDLNPGGLDQSPSNQALRLKPLRHLKTLGLAEETTNGTWALKSNWSNTLKELGRRGDIIRTMSAAFPSRDLANSLEHLAPGSDRKVIGSIPADELKGTRQLIVDGIDGKTWAIDVGNADQNGLPPKGAIIEATAPTHTLKRADETINAIAARTNGKWSP